MFKHIMKITAVLLSVASFALILCLFVLSLCSVIAQGQEKQVKLVPHNTVALRGYVDEESTSRLVDEIIRNENDTIFMVIDSGGGSVNDGFKMIDAMKASGKKFVCIAVSAASMAFSIFQTCDVRYVTDHAVLMQHIGSYRLGGDANRNKSYTIFAEKLFERLNKSDRERIGMSKDQFNAMIKDDWWVLGGEAVKANIADAVVSVSCSKDLAEKRIVDKYSLTHADITIIKAGCPMVSEPVFVSIEPKSGSSSIDVAAELKTKNFDRKIHPSQYFGSHESD